MGEVVAVDKDVCTHGAAPLKSVVDTVQVENKGAIAVFQSNTMAIPPCGLYIPPPTNNHPEGAVVMGPDEGSETVFAGGFPVHRNNDPRGCGAKTVSTVGSVFCG